MTYLDVLPLAEAKLYLRIDDTQNETDAEITSMIRSAFSYVERRTNVMLYDRDKRYLVEKGCVKVYDYPINSIQNGVTATTQEKSLYTNYTVDSTLDKITLNVGYTDKADVPTDFIDLVKVMVDVMYYEKDKGKDFKDALPLWAKEILETNKRFLI